MPCESKAGDISQRIHTVKLRKERADLIGLTHQFSREALMRRLQLALFFCGGVNADPQRFGQNQ